MNRSWYFGAAGLTAALVLGLALPPAVAGQLEGVTVQAGEDGFGIRSADNAFALRLGGGAQYDGRFFPDDDGAAVDGFELRRLRTDLRGTLYSDYDFRVNLENAGNRVDVQDAYLDARLAPALAVQVGKFKVPFGLERLQSIWALPFAERSLASALAPNRDVGIQLHGSLFGPIASYAIGVFNGVPDGASGDTDNADSKDIAGRIFVLPFAANDAGALRGLGIGVSGMVGDQAATPDASGLPSPRTAIGRGTFLSYRSDGTAAGTVLADGRRTRVSPQAYWYWNNVGLLGEYVLTRTDVTLDAATSRLDQSAWQATGSWVLTGERASYRGVSPTRSFSPENGGWGAWEVVARYQNLEGDRDAFPLLADPTTSALRASGYAIGVNWYLNGGVRFLTDFEHTNFDFVAGGGSREAENVLISRFQVAF